MRSPLFILIAAFILSLLVAQQVNRFSPAHPNSSVDRLLTAVRHDSGLALALAAADRGEGGALIEWLNSAQPEERIALANMVLDLCFHVAGLKPTDDAAEADAVLYRYRNRLAAFANIPTGDAETDANLDNVLAYVSVAGTTTPSAGDLAIAKRILPRLEKLMEKNPVHEVWDTIGCVRFVAGDYIRSRVAFDEAVRLGERSLAKTSGSAHGPLERQVALYRERRQAAVDAGLRTVESGGRATPIPLPLPVAPAPAPAAAPPVAASPAAPGPEKP